MPKQPAVIHKRNASTILAPLRQFFFKHGHIHVPNFPEYETLFDQCNKLRMSRSQLSSSVIEELDGMGFLWDLQLSNELKWYYHYAELRRFYDEFGHTRVPAKRGQYKSLGTWVLRQRRDEMLLPEESKKLLNQLSFEWSEDIKRRREMDWKWMFTRLEKFYKKHGHSNVPDRYKLDVKLGRWVSTVRYGKESLENWKIALLKTVKFKFTDDIRKDKATNRQILFQKLHVFYKKQGHANVPENYVDSKLSLFIAYLRQYPERIKPEEKKQLKSWNFLFSKEIKERRENLWMKSFKKLEGFKNKYGHCRVPSTYEEKTLANWVAIQRRDKKGGKLSQNREKKLREMGFSFYEDVAAEQERTWMTMYDKLLHFKKAQGTTIVKESYNDSKLAYWVMHQRKAKNKMLRNRKRLLNKIGFVWKMR